MARVPIAELVDPANRLRVRHPSGWIGPAFDVAEHAGLGLHRRRAVGAARAGRLGPAVGRPAPAAAVTVCAPTDRCTVSARLRRSGIGPYPERVPGSVVDLVLIVLIVVFAINGYRQGFVVGLLSFVGFFGGAADRPATGPLLAELLQRAVVPRSSSRSACVFGLALLGQALATWVGVRIRGGIRNRTGQTLDDVGGAVVSVVALLIVVWLVAAPLGSSSLPGLARAVRTSAILHGVDAVMPQQAQALSNELRYDRRHERLPGRLRRPDPDQRAPGPAARTRRWPARRWSRQPSGRWSRSRAARRRATGGSRAPGSCSRPTGC